MGEQQDLEQAFRNQNTWFLVPTVTQHLRNSLEVVQASLEFQKTPREPRDLMPSGLRPVREGRPREIH